MGRLEKLKELEGELYSLMRKANSRAIPAIAKQYRDTLREIEEIEGDDGDDDPIAAIAGRRAAKG